MSIAATKDLFVSFLRYLAPIHVHLLALLLDFAMVRLNVVDKAIDQLNLILKALNERFG